MIKLICKKALPAVLCAVLFPVAVFAAQGNAKNDDGDMTVEEILAHEPTAEDYGSGRRCIQSRRIRNTEILNEQYMALRVGQDEYYIVEFQHRCPGLRRGRTVIFEPSSSSSLCVHDSIRPVQDNGLGGITAPTRCAIPSFQQVNKEQLSMLKDALKVEARREQDERSAARQERKDARRAEKEAKRAEKKAQKEAKQARKEAEKEARRAQQEAEEADDDDD